MRREARLPALKLNDLVGEKFLRFRVGSVVARSRSGIVFRALDPKNERTVALKVFWPDFFADEKSMRRFLRAVRTMLPLEHERRTSVRHVYRSFVPNLRRLPSPSWGSIDSLRASVFTTEAGNSNRELAPGR